jgi:large subunit ribosomal protein L4
VKLSKGMKRAALFSVLARKYKDGELILVDSLSFGAPKTKEAKAALVALSKAADASTLATKRVNAAFIALPRKDAAVEKSFRNIGSVSVGEVRNLNPVEILSSRYLVIESPAAAFAALVEKRKN